MENKSATIQELGMDNEVNLCDSCNTRQPECEGTDIIFGNGKGNDNVCACNGYEALLLNND